MTGEDGDLGLFSREAALAAGLSDTAIRRARERGILTSVARGAYLPTSVVHRLTGPEAERIRLAAVVPGLAGDPVVSHVSAAILHGLPFTHSDAPYVHVTRHAAVKSRRGAGVYAHRGAVPDDEVVVLGGLRVTSAARTVLDCAQVLPRSHAVAVADAALYRGLTAPGELADVLARYRRRPGARRVADIIAFADGRAGDPWESHSRVALAGGDVPAPEPGFAVPGVDGDGRCRAAFGWPAHGVLGEPEQAAHATDNDLAARGFAVVRWSWADLSRPQALLARVGAALVSGALGQP